MALLSLSLTVLLGGCGCGAPGSDGTQADGSDATAEAADVAPDAEEPIDQEVWTGDGADADGGGADTDGGGPLNCTSCHGSVADGDPAPPRDTMDRTDTTLPTVGAHRGHLHGSAYFRTGQCTDCHVVPATIDAPGHIDASPADLTWGAVPTAGGSTPAWDGTTCSIYCHGQTLPGGAHTTPDWTRVGVGEAACGNCHGVPPPYPHPALPSAWACTGCHPFDGLVPIDPERHVNGVLDVTADCTTCHGDAATNPGPPVDTHGATSTSARGVGAHQSHLGPSDWHAQVTCDQCHVVPTGITDPAHIDGDGTAELTFGTLATTDGAMPSWDGTTCTGAYCHGATLSGGTDTTPIWTTVDGTQDACGTCHGLPPGGAHPSVLPGTCYRCHGAVIDASGDFVAPELHIDGVVEVAGRCGDCHGLPPDTGTHLLHAGLAAPVYGSTSTTTAGGGYAFGCGNCHPIDPAHHMNGGLAEVELYSPAAPAGSLKALNPPTADYVPGGTVMTDSFGVQYTMGTCSDAYCHSGMRTTSSDVARPGIDFPFVGYPISYPPYTVARTRAYATPTWGATLDCGGCHGYPPRASSPGDVAAAGESHSYIAPEGWEDLHMWDHGFDPLPCRTCHSLTVTQAATFSRDAAGVSSFGDLAIAAYDRHVDGTADVLFDTVDPIVFTTAAGPVPMDLTTAVYDSATHTCVNVACHLNQYSVTFGSPFRTDDTAECNSCHQY